jgi:Calx-beta domain
MRVSHPHSCQIASDLKWKHVIVLIGLCFLSSSAVSGQYFTVAGAHNYALNSTRQVFDVSPDGKIGISLTDSFLSTFDPILGTQFDSKPLPGFGPLGVTLAQVGSGLRAVVLTSEGGPRRIYLFDVSSTGQLTQLASTQLTTSNSDSGSNMILSGVGQAGFVSVATSSGADLVSFSLNDGSILNRLPGSGASTLFIKELPNSRLVAFRNGNTLKVVNASNPSQLTVIGSVPLFSNGEFSGSFDDGLAFSSDGRFVFLGNQFYNFAAIDLNSMQVVGSIPGANYRFSRVRIFESAQQRLLAVLSSQSGTTGITAILLVDATDPAHLSIVNQYIPLSTETFFTKSDFAFSHDGARLYAAPKEKLIAFDLPTFNKAWEQPVPGSVLQVHQLEVYGPNDEVLGAWDISGGLGFTGIFGAFPAFPPNVSISESTTVGEGDGVANFTISLSSSAAPHQVIIKYATADGTATQGSDYTNTSGTLTFAPGVITKTVSVPIIDDTIDEFDETFTMNIQSASPGIITRAQSTATIVDNDPPPSASINDVSIGEGNSGSRNATFFVSLSSASGKPITLSYATADDTATAGDDYVAASGTITFSPGQTSSPIIIQVKGDTLNEGNETFVVNLSNPVNVTIADGQGVCTIVDDDAALLATELNSQRAIALDSVTFVRDPFAVTNPNYFGADHRTRVILFSTNLIVTPGLVVTAQAVDSQQTTYQLPVEFVGSLPTFLGFAQIVVKLPDGISVAGDLQVSINARGRTSNKVLVGVVP